MDHTDARARFAAARVARLASVRPDGRPHLVPVTFAVVGEHVVTAVDHKPKSTRRLARLRNIAANPAVSLLTDGYREDWSQLWWVRADGTARIVDAGPDFDTAIEALAARYTPYRTNPPEGPVIDVAVHTWRGWQA